MMSFPFYLNAFHPKRSIHPIPSRSKILSMKRRWILHWTWWRQRRVLLWEYDSQLIFGCTYIYIYIYIYVFIQVVPGRAGGGSFKRKKNHIAEKEFAYRMCARWPTIALSKLFVWVWTKLLPLHGCDVMTCFQVMWLVVRWFVVLLRYYSVLQRPTTYYSRSTLYYKVLLQYYSVLQSSTPVLLCTTKYYASTTLY